MQKMGVAKLDELSLRVHLASHIDREASLALGLFPDVPIDKVVVVGNAAGDWRTHDPAEQGQEERG